MNLLFLTILFPLLGFITLAISQGKWSEHTSSLIGVGTVGISVLVAICIIFDFYCNFDHDVTFVFVQELWNWFTINALSITVALRLDGLSLIMLSVVIGVGFIIHLYAAWYMSGCEGYSRFFAYTNLFMANMVLLVLSDNLLLMYVGWEGVGLCSYLLIGFYYSDARNGIAALKSLIMTRFGDICLICALFMIYDQYHTLSFNKLLTLELKYSSSYFFNNNNVTLISFMLLIGAIGKSAQLPLQNWLISAMVGPSPVSALIHAATMVTSGVYLIIRMNKFFLMTPNILYLTGVIGSLTVVLFSCSALFQSNIKKILAYSTISQIGYMFLALGGRHWDAAIFHLVTHSFFKALLFLSAGSLTYACRNEQNIFKMGGLYKFVPLIYVCFLIGGASLSGVPIVTAGVYSKEMIMLKTLANHDYFFLFSGLIGVFLTPIYTFRMIFIVFHGEKKIDPSVCNNIIQNLSLILLLLLSTFIGGWIKLPLLTNTIVVNVGEVCNHSKIYFEIILGFLVIFGIWMALFFWMDSVCRATKQIIKPRLTEVIERYIVLLCYYGWGFDWFYKLIFVKPYLFITKKLSHSDPVDVIVNVIVSLFCWLRNGLICSENGKLNWYIVSINIGAAIILIMILTNDRI
ncbi:NADH-quinone oxidoreductase subunit L [Blochmannia endosymbiont of Camponotus sp. C-003]|uniref:NADH-quinone oxidoreductase subunit L n=1 Tax=unclassified Candidatus Blochmanniella TaxID=711328 RepID=UPI0020248C3B|nr:MULTISPECIES: NADH-quinone oxidoreductase subunit L [unclassified Candidatus Blochmannia]URJ23347.1 NADH-quinone oxidoreductase subunit L [Blochmannia endosymbiont of Camponotus sp. C-003]URJ28820.1 NADH-quinone oxidoreductase subunit L [Blochmannia endosymbiont of Camponotus sp. C-046]